MYEHYILREVITTYIFTIDTARQEGERLCHTCKTLQNLGTWIIMSLHAGAQATAVYINATDSILTVNFYNWYTFTFMWPEHSVGSTWGRFVPVQSSQVQMSCLNFDPPPPQPLADDPVCCNWCHIHWVHRVHPSTCQSATSVPTKYNFTFVTVSIIRTI